jgi:methionyl-tRNA synthetase
VWQLIGRTNKYIDETQPWSMVKDEAKREVLGSVMYALAESQRISSVLLRPFLTKTPQLIWQQLGIAAEDQTRLTSWASVHEFGLLPSGTVVQKGEPMFPRLDVEPEIGFIVQAMAGSTAPAVAEPAAAVPAAGGVPAPEPKEEIGIDDFAKVELRVAQVIAAEPVKGADKLLKLQLDLGYEQRQVVSGIAKFYSPEQLVGRKLICVVNLKPAKLRGELSQGMILAASHGDQLTLATVPDEMPNGAIVK